MPEQPHHAILNRAKNPGDTYSTRRFFPPFGMAFCFNSRENQLPPQPSIYRTATSISRLQMSIFRLKMDIFKLKMCIFSLKIEQTAVFANFSGPHLPLFRPCFPTFSPYPNSFITETYHRFDGLSPIIRPNSLRLQPTFTSIRLNQTVAVTHNPLAMYRSFYIFACLNDR